MQGQILAEEATIGDTTSVDPMVVDAVAPLHVIDDGIDKGNIIVLVLTFDIAAVMPVSVDGLGINGDEALPVGYGVETGHGVHA